jgi:betaine lipid synthase
VLIGSLLIYSPYYVWIGCSRSRSTEQHVNAFEIESGNTAGSGHLSPLHSPASSDVTVIVEPATVPDLDLGPAAMPVVISRDVAKKTAIPLPWSSFHYNSK